ncbi:MAG: hypothetical protein JOZ15_14045, partial [Acidobacteria bacterium]|nr:hypothetical protein [Acidobacteriota bacterium]
MQTVFLLSPATTSGRRAAQLAAAGSRSAAAARLRSPEGLPIGEAFAFLSALYFRGKLAYARPFARMAPRAGAILVIAPGFGLVPPEWPLTVERLHKLAGTPVDPTHRGYSAPLRRDARDLA